MEKEVLEQLRSYAADSNKNISVVLNEAVVDYLTKVRLRPAFMKASADIIEENKELLQKLAK
jgi:hypothetical protein